MARIPKCPKGIRFVLMVIVPLLIIVPPSTLGAIAGPGQGGGPWASPLQEPPPVFTFQLDLIHVDLNITGNTTDQVVSYPGTIQTNYPGLKISFYMMANCWTFNTTVSPGNITVRGVATMDLFVNVTVPPGTKDNTTGFGKLTIVAMIEAPGRTSSSTSVATFTLAVMNEDDGRPMLTHTDPSDIRTTGPDDDGGLTLGVMLNIMLLVLLAVVIIVAKVVKLKLKKGKGTLKGTRKKGVGQGRT